MPGPMKVSLCSELPVLIAKLKSSSCAVRYADFMRKFHTGLRHSPIQVPKLSINGLSLSTPWLAKLIVPR